MTRKGQKVSKGTKGDSERDKNFFHKVSIYLCFSSKGTKGQIYIKNAAQCK